MGIDALLGKGDGLRVTDVIISEDRPKGDLVFDPEVDISPDNWARIGEYLHTLPDGSERLSNLRDILCYILPVYPQARQYLDPHGEFFEPLVNELCKIRGDVSVFNIFDLALLKLAYPEKPFDLGSDFRAKLPSLLTRFEFERDKVNHDTDWGSYLMAGFCRKVFGVEKRTDPFQSERIAQAIIYRIDSQRKRGFFMGRDLALFKLLYPEFIGEIPYEKEIKTLEPSVTSAFEAQPAKIRGGSFFELSILSAQDAHFTEDGFLIVKPIVDLPIHPVAEVPKVRGF